MGAENSNQTDKPRFVGEWVRVSDAFDLRMGKTPSRKNPLYWRDGENDWISIADLGSFDKFVGDTKERISEIAVAESGIKPVPADTVLMSFKLSIGKTSITTKPVYTNEAIIAFVDKGIYPVHPDFMYHQCMAKNWSTAANTAVMGKTLNKKTLGQAMVYLPDIAKQREIAGKLDYIDGQIARIKKTSSKLDSLVKSRFVEMFGAFDLSLQKSAWYPIKQLGQVVSGATPKTSIGKYWDGGIKWITPAELSDMSGWVYDSARHITEEGLNSCGARMMPVGTVILSSRAPIGKMALLGDSMCCNQGFKNIVCGDRVIPEYLYYLLGFNTAYLNSLGRGATFKELSKRSVEEIKIPVPSIKAQGEFVAFTQQVDKLRFAGNHEMNFRCERFTLS